MSERVAAGAGLAQPDEVVGSACARDRPRAISIRTLAPLTRSLGANDHRHRAMPGHIQPLSLQFDGTSGHTQHRPGTFRKCLLSSRSRVRVAVGAQVTVLNSTASSTLRRTAGSQTAVTVAPFRARSSSPRPPARSTGAGPARGDWCPRSRSGLCGRHARIRHRGLARRQAWISSIGVCSQVTAGGRFRTCWQSAGCC